MYLKGDDTLSFAPLETAAGLGLLVNSIRCYVIYHGRKQRTDLGRQVLSGKAQVTDLP